MKPLPEMTSPELEMELQRQIRITVESGHEWAKAKAMYEAAEDLKKTVLAKNISDSGSMAERQNAGVKSLEYEAHLVDIGVRREAFLDALTEYEMGKIKIDAIRSVISNRRIEDRKFHGG